MASSTFHLFHRLPRELRSLIWTFAIRPSRAGVHFFTVFNPHDDAERNQLGDGVLVNSGDNGYKSGIATVQHCEDDSHGHCRTRSDPSAYLLDQGMWSACKESIQAMEDHSGAREGTLVKSGGGESLRSRKNPDAAANGCFLSSGEVRRFTTRPRSDLFCFRPLDFDTVDWRRINMHMPLFRSHRGQVAHIALEFDPRCFSDHGLQATSPSRNAWFRCFFNILKSRLKWAGNLWLIDYRIRRIDDEAPAEDGRLEFYGSGFRFSEVREYDAGWDVDPEVAFNNVFDFIRVVKEMFDGDGYESDGFEYSSWSHLSIRDVRVLACERWTGGESPNNRMVDCELAEAAAFSNLLELGDGLQGLI